MVTGFGAGLAIIDCDTNIAALNSIGGLDSVIDIINQRRGNLGAFVNRLESAAQNLQISIENQASAESRIRNVDVATESSELTRNQILQQSAASILMQANQTPALALKLIQG